MERADDRYAETSDFSAILGTLFVYPAYLIEESWTKPRGDVVWHFDGLFTSEDKVCLTDSP